VIVSVGKGISLQPMMADVISILGSMAQAKSTYAVNLNPIEVRFVQGKNEIQGESDLWRTH